MILKVVRGILLLILLFVVLIGVVKMQPKNCIQKIQRECQSLGYSREHKFIGDLVYCRYHNGFIQIENKCK